MLDDKWAHRILYVLNDAFYRGTPPEPLEKGVTVLLPKTAAPEGAQMDSAASAAPQPAPLRPDLQVAVVRQGQAVG